MNKAIKHKSWGKAERVKAKASILIEGLQSNGKTGLSLELAFVLAGAWDRVGVIDTENNSAPLYLGRTLSIGEKIPNSDAFNHINLTKELGYTPSHYLYFRDEAIKAGMGAIINDSISHSWTRQGGVLDMVNKARQKNPSGNNYTIWGQDDIAVEKNSIFEIIRDPNIHVISTVRVKEKQEIEKGDDGRNKIVSLGEQQLQQDGLKYEPDLGLKVIRPGAKDRPTRVLITKSRYPMFEKDEEYDMTLKLMLQLKEYLDEGADPDDLLEQTRQEYIAATVEFLDTHPNQVPVWNMIKEANKYTDTKLSDIPLKDLRNMYGQLTSE